MKKEQKIKIHFNIVMYETIKNEKDVFHLLEFWDDEQRIACLHLYQ